MKKSVLLFAAIVFAQCFTNLFAQTKIGYISVDEIFALMPETRKADSSLAAYQKDLANTYAEQEAELNAALDKFIKDFCDCSMPEDCILLPTCLAQKNTAKMRKTHHPATNKLVCLGSFSKTLSNMLVSSRAMDFPSFNKIAVI